MHKQPRTYPTTGRIGTVKKISHQEHTLCSWAAGARSSCQVTDCMVVAHDPHHQRGGMHKSRSNTSKLGIPEKRSRINQSVRRTHRVPSRRCSVGQASVPRPLGLGRLNFAKTTLVGFKWNQGVIRRNEKRLERKVNG